MVNLSMSEYNQVIDLGLYLFYSQEREEGRERNIDVREEHQLVASPMCPNEILNLQPRYVL